MAVALAVGAGMAALGATGTAQNGVGEGAVRRTHRSATATTAVAGLALGAVLIARGDALDGSPVPTIAPGALLIPVLSPGGPTASLASFFGLVVVAALACRWALSVLPLAELSPRARRRAVERTIDRLDADCRAVTRYGVVAVGASLPTALPAVRETLPVAAAGALLAPTAPRGLLLLLAVVAAALALAGRLLQAATGTTAATLGRLLPATVGGVGVTLVAVAVDDTVRGAVDGLPPAVRPVAARLLDALSPTGVVLGVALVALVALTAALTGVVVLRAVGLVPTRGGGALAGAGLSACAIVLGLGGAPPLATFGLVGLGVVAWDVSDRGVRARADLGPGSAASVETVHAVGSVAVAAVGVGVARASLGLVGAVSLPDGAVLGAVVAVAAAVILLGVLRA
jgi:hypothetical protein